MKTTAPMLIYLRQELVGTLWLRKLKTQLGLEAWPVGGLEVTSPELLREDHVSEPVI